MTKKEDTSDKLIIIRNIDFSSLEYDIPIIIEEIENLNYLDNLKNSYILLHLIDSDKEVKIEFYISNSKKKSLLDKYKLINTTIDAIKKQLEDYNQK